VRDPAKNESALISLGSPGFAAAAAGGKASSLHELLTAGFPVPPGFIVPACADLDRIKNELRAAVVALGGYPLAVRSSAQFEDLAAASFAGQYATYLKIATLPRLIEAIVACRASGNNGHAVSYLHKNGFEANNSRVSVLIQKVIDASVAGVAFSIHPHTGREEHALVECCRGLGDRLVSGQTTPTQYVMRLEDGDVIERKAGGEDVPLDNETLRKLCRYALELQAHFGAPQDIEWALDRSGELWILQSRPVTRIHWRCEIDEFTNANFRDGGVAARVCTPLMYSLYRDAFQSSMQRYFAAIKLIPRTGPQRRWVNMFYGRPYWCSSAVKEVLSKVPGYDEQRFDQDLGIQKDYGSEGPVRTPITPRTLVATLPVAFALEQEYRRQLRITKNYGQSFVRDEAHYLRLAGSFATMPNAEFLSTLVAVLRFHERVEADYLTTVYNHVNYQTDFNKFLARISDTTGELISSVVLMSGLRDVSHMGIHRGFVKLVQTGRQQGINSAAWDATLADFLQENFHHGNNELDISTPRWGERPECIKQMVADVLHSGIEPKDAETAAREQFELYSAEVQKVIATLRRSLWHQLRFEQSFRKRLNTARTYASRREQMREYSTRAGCVVRQYALEAGRRFHRDGWLSHEKDVFMLHTEDIMAIAEHKAANARVLAVTRFRSLMYRGYRMLEPPGELGKGILEPAPVPLVESSGTVLLKGTGCSVGRVQARARVVTTLAECHDLNPREILVTRSTDPAWTPVFGLVSGVVTEVGGLLSHGAVLGREYGLPTVFNVPRATQIIKTGQMLEVDGSLGTVRILTTEDETPSACRRDAECGAQIASAQVTEKKGPDFVSEVRQ
jgi:phosphohistidine swiveling domain-containing protein